MTALLRPRVATRQPQYPARLCTSGIARGLLHLWGLPITGHQVLDLASGANGAFGSNTWGVDASGQYISFGGTSAYDVPVGNASGSGGALVPFTFFAQVYLPSFAANAALYGGANGGLDIRTNTSGGVDLLVQNTALIASSSGITLAANKWQTVSVSYDGAKYAIYINGVAAGSGAASNSFMTTAQMYLGAALSSPNDRMPSGGRLRMVGVWSRILSAPEVASLSANPWQLFWAPARISPTLVKAVASSNSASGAAVLPAFLASGAASQSQSAVAAIVLAAFAVTASAPQAQAASATLSLPAFSVSASASQGQGASGAVALSAFVASGSASQSQAPSASAVLPAITAAGSASQAQGASAAVILPEFVATGSVSIPGGATAALILPQFSMAGTATQAQVGTASLVLPPFAVNGTGAQSQSASAALSLPAFLASGTAINGGGITATLALPPFAFSGSAVQSQGGSAILSSPAFTVMATAAQSQSASGVPALPSFTAAGSIGPAIPIPVNTLYLIRTPSRMRSVTVPARRRLIKVHSAMPYAQRSFDPLEVGETRPLSFDLTLDLAPTETISIVNWTCSAYGGATDPNAQSLVGADSLTGNVVTVLVTAGLPAFTYLLEATAQTNIGVIKWWSTFTCKASGVI